MGKGLLEQVRQNIGDIIITPEDVALVSEELRTKDPHKLLGDEISSDFEGRRNYLAGILTLAKNLGIPRKDLALFEFGANQIEPLLSRVYSSGIAQYLALEGNRFPFEYTAFDTNYTAERLEDGFKLLDGNGGFVGWNHPLGEDSPEVVERLYEALKKISLDFYTIEERVCQAESEDKVPVVFSNHVFNHGNKDPRWNFWDLPGLHVHTVGFLEMSDQIGMKKVDESDVTRYKRLRAEFETSSEEHIGALKRHINFYKEDLDIRGHLALGFDLVSYYWAL